MHRIRAVGGRGPASVPRHPNNSVQRLQSSLLKAGAAPVASWEAVAETAGSDALDSFYLNKGSSPSTSPTKPLDPSPKPDSSKPVVLYRDTNAWCPYCQKVWMVLLEKGIEFDSVLIELFDKPSWYGDIIESKQTPAARINGEFVGESDDIMLKLEADFADSPTLLPADQATEIREFLKEFNTVSRSIFKSNGFGVELTEEQEEVVKEVQTFLDSMEERIEKNGGPFLFGDFSLADITVAPFLPNIVRSKLVQLNLSQHPRVAAAVQALLARPSMQATRVDDHTRHIINTRLFNNPVDIDLQVSDAERRARSEAAAKIAANREVIRARLLSHSGIVRASGSSYGETMRNVNGKSVNPNAATFEAEVDRALLRVCTTLLTGDVGSSPASKEGVAVQVAALAYFRNLGSAPRDLSAPAMDELRAACDAVIQAAYEFPEKKFERRSS